MTDAPDDDFDITVDDDDDDDDDAVVSKEEHERTKAALKRANAEAKKHRLKNKELVAQLTGGKKDGDDKDDSRAKELERQHVREEAAEETASKYKTKLLHRASESALLKAGLMGDPSKLARLVTLDEVDVDDDGEVDDDQLDEAVEKIRDDYPELFRDKEEKQRMPVRRTRIDGGDRGRQVRQRPRTSAEKIQDRVLGRRPR